MDKFVAKRVKVDLESSFDELVSHQVCLRKIASDEDLDLDYSQWLSTSLATDLMQQLQDTLEYYEGNLTKVRIFGKWHQIPRQQVAYGDEGLKYTFSGNTIPAKPWTKELLMVKDALSKVTGVDFNFVLVNRYRNGNDHIGEHKDNEPDLDSSAPIASLSLGQPRQFVLKHSDARKKNGPKRHVKPVKILLEHGSLLLMNPPTNQVWYHSLPKQASAKGVRINLTFRKIQNRV